MRDERKESPQRRQATVACTDRDLTLLLDVFQERDDGPVVSVAGEAQEQPPSVSIGHHRVTREIALLSQSFVEEGMQQGGEGGRFHDTAS